MGDEHSAENDALLTSDEHDAIRQAGDLWGTLCRVVDEGPTRSADLAELVVHVHAIQHAVMSQAAARAHPDTYRLLGSTLSTRVIPPIMGGEQ